MSEKRTHASALRFNSGTALRSNFSKSLKNISEVNFPKKIFKQVCCQMFLKKRERERERERKRERGKVRFN